MSVDDRLAALEDSVAQLRNKLGMDSQPAAASPRLPPGWEELPVSFVVVGFSRDQYALRPAKYAGEPVADRVTSRGDMMPTSYRHNPLLPAWQNAAAWESAGRPSKDADGRVLDVRGAPVGRQDFSPT